MFRKKKKPRRSPRTAPIDDPSAEHDFTSNENTENSKLRILRV